MMSSRRWLAVLLCPALACIAAAAATPFRVESFSPQGEARGATQVVIRYSAPVVRFGDPLAADPVTTDCGPGQGRWLDERSWAYEFAQPLRAGITCSFTARKGLKSLAGLALAGDARQAVVSGAPAVVAIAPEAGTEIDAEQAFLLRLDGALDPASLEAVGCTADGVSEGIAVRTVAPALRERLLVDLARERWAYLAFMRGGEAEVVEDDGEGAPTDAAIPWRSAALERDVIALECARPLPSGARVRLAWGPGLRAANGTTSGTAQQFDYKVREAFTLRLECTRVQSKSPCLPLQPLSLDFSAPVSAAKALAVRLRTPDGRLLAPREQGRERVPMLERVSFAGPFLPRGRYRLELPPGFVDDAGRVPANVARFPLVVEMDELPPLAKFAASFGVLERAAAPALPVTLRDVEERAPGAAPAVPGRVLTLDDDLAVMRWLRRLEQADNSPKDGLLAAERRARAIAVPRAGHPGTTEVVGIPLPTPGFHIVELASPRLGARLLEPAAPYFVRAAALVTNLGVHFKQGRENSLVWVTRLDRGEPVAGAAITIRDCRGRVVFRGKGGPDGIARVPGASLPADQRGCEGWWHGWFVVARAGDDFAFALGDWNDGLGSWDFGLQGYAGTDGPYTAHAVFDRSLLRAGETLGIKLFVRARTGAGLELPAAADWPDRIVISHYSGQDWELPVRIESGAAAVQWNVPKEARLGTYRVVARRGKEGPEVEAGEFRVEDFRLPTMRAVVQLPAGRLVAPPRVPVDVAVTYLAGGGASGAAVQLRSRTEPYTPQFDGYDDFSFGTREVREGLLRYGDYSDSGEQPPAGPAALIPLALDAHGGARTEVAAAAAATAPRRLLVEMEYPDASGERLTTSATATVWPAAIAVGLRPARWPRAGRPFDVDAVVLDLDGKPVAGRDVRVEAFSRAYFSYRRRLVGGFYAYDGGVDVRRLGEVCRATSDAQGRIRCSVTLAGNDGLMLRARATDAAGREATAVDNVWLAGADAWYGGTDSDRMDLVPERRRYEAGETAKLRAEMPFRAATALVTVEREGVLDAFVRPLTAREPVVSVPIRAAHAPNVYVSVLAVRGRVAEPAPTALVDLGRPSFRLGITELEVGRRPHELVVGVSTDRAIYATREKARVRVSVRRADGGALPPGAEIAFVAVDEALLELSPNDSWDVLEAMLAPRSLEVGTATSIGQVIGRRHYGRKAVPAGGGGGRMPTRELFQPLLQWTARMPLDVSGHATLEVPLNDSLSSFRLVAIASAGTSLFGTGSASVRTHRDLMLFAGLPEVVREGDRLQATVIVRNAGATRTTAIVTATAAPDRGAGSALPVQRAELAPGESRELAWTYEVPQDARSLAWTLAADGSGAARDEIRVRQRVLAWPGEPNTWQATLRRLDRPVSLAVAPPTGAVPGVGGVEVALSSSLTASLAGVRDSMAAYPYGCIEQRASKAIALGDRTAWDGMTASLPAHVAADGLVSYFPGLRHGNPELTAYLVAISSEAGWDLPEPVRGQLLDALARVGSGERPVRLGYGGAPLLMRLAALEALSRYGRVEPAWLESLSSTPDTWPTTALLDWLAVLERTPAAAQRAQRLAAARQLLRTRMSVTGTRLVLEGEQAEGWPWLLVNGDRNALRAIALLVDDPAFQADLPALVLGAVGRQVRGSWNTTVANAWGSLALRRYAARFEREPVTGVTTLTAPRGSGRLDWAREPRGGSLALDWNQAAGRLALTHAGTGAPYAVLRSVAAVPLTRPVAAGYRVTRSVSPVVQARPGQWTRGDVVRVRLEIEAGADAVWVVANDPVPAGATIIGGGLKRGDEPLPKPPARGAAPAWPSFVERRNDSYRAYFEVLPRGRWQLEYTVRLNAAGRFVTPATRVESMYEPDRFGALPNAPIEVRAAP